MKRCVILLTGLLAAVLLYAQGPMGTHKVSPWLRKAMAEQRREIRRDGEEKEILVVTFVQLNGKVTDEQLAAYDCRRYAQLDDIAIVMLPLNRIEELAQLNTVLRIEANEKAHTTLDTVPTIVKALPVYQVTEEHPAFTGSGVVMGLMDVGFDLTHPTLYADGKYRISAYWDQLFYNDDNTRLPVGLDFVTAEEIEGMGCATDGRTQDHGNHTLGIAAGSGFDTPYRGLAFDSDICIVSNAVSSDINYIPAENYYKYTTASDALGFKYIFDYAESQGKPCVVSFSEGYSPYIDNDDRLYAAFLSKLIGPGRILVAAAGNENTEFTYVEKPRGMEMAGAFVKSYRNSASYRIKTDGAFRIHLYAYQQGTSTPYPPLVLSMAGEEPEAEMEDVMTFNEESCNIKLYRYPSSENPNDTIYLLTLQAEVTLNKLPDIAIVAEGKNCYAELFGSTSSALRNLPDVDSRWCAAEYGHNILAPGCFDAPICVGATTHRQGYVNAAGEYVENNHDTKGRWAFYSSTGPALNGRQKPDVSAPGTNVISALSSYYMEANPTHTTHHVAYSDFHQRRYAWGINTGTSMATPVVAGTIALWLQAKPDLTRNDIMDIFSRTCRHPEEGIPYPNNKYGYGEIDAYSGLLDILGLTAIKDISRNQPSAVRITEKDGQLLLSFDQPPSVPVTVSIYSTAGTLLLRKQLTPSSSQVTIALPPTATGIYVVQVNSPEFGITGSQLIRRA